MHIQLCIVCRKLPSPSYVHVLCPLVQDQEPVSPLQELHLLLEGFASKVNNLGITCTAVFSMHVFHSCWEIIIEIAAGGERGVLVLIGKCSALSAFPQVSHCQSVHVFHHVCLGMRGQQCSPMS